MVCVINRLKVLSGGLFPWCSNVSRLSNGCPVSLGLLLQTLE